MLGHCDAKRKARIGQWDIRNPVLVSLQTHIEDLATSISSLLHFASCFFCNNIRSSHQKFTGGFPSGCVWVPTCVQYTEASQDSGIINYTVSNSWTGRTERVSSLRDCKISTCEIKLNIASLGV